MRPLRNDAHTHRVAQQACLGEGTVVDGRLMSVNVGDLAPDIDLPDWYRLRIFGGGTSVYF